MSLIPPSTGGGGATDPPDAGNIDLTPEPVIDPDPEPAPEPNRSERTPSNPFGDSGPTVGSGGVITDDNGSSTPMGADPDGDGDTSESAAEDDAVGTIPDDSDPEPDPEPADDPPTTPTGSDNPFNDAGSYDDSADESDDTDDDPLLTEDDTGRARAYVEDTTDSTDTSTTPGGMSNTIEEANNDGDPSTTAVDAVEDVRDELDASTEPEPEPEPTETTESSGLDPKVLLAGLAAVAVVMQS